MLRFPFKQYTRLLQHQFHDLTISNSRISSNAAFRTHSQSYNSNDDNRSNGTNQNSDGDKSQDNDDDRNKGAKYTLLAAAGTVALARSPNEKLDWPRNQDISPDTDWNTFCWKMLAKGEVEEVIVFPGTDRVLIRLRRDAVIDGVRPLYNTYQMRVPSADAFEVKLREFERTLGVAPGYEIPIRYQRGNSVFLYLVLIGLAGYLYYRFGRNIRAPQNFTQSFFKLRYTLVDPAAPKSTQGIRFSDVAGLKEAKIEIMEFVNYLKNSERFLKLGAKLPKGVLLTGPPGCGKTLLAKAVANEANVPFLAMAGTDFIEIVGGVGASRVRELFQKAKKLAPCIIYIDEVDSIGKKRGGSEFTSNQEADQTLNQLLVEMDGMMSQKGIILLASTNRAEVLDKALLRPGRFDRQILIDYPNVEEREELFIKHASKIKLQQPPEEMAHRIARLTPGMSGADLANVCNEAALHAARKDKKEVSIDDIEFAIERVVGGTEKRESSISPAERKIIAYHESGHALVGWLLEHTDPVLKISIVPRMSKALGYTQFDVVDRKLHSKEEFFDKMCMALGGRVAELLKFNHLSTGAQDDLQRVTKMALAQIREFGFDPVIGQVSFELQEGYKKPYSKRLANVMDSQASKMVKEAFDRTYELLKQNETKLNILAKALMTKEVMKNSDIEQLIGPRPFNAARASASS